MSETGTNFNYILTQPNIQNSSNVQGHEDLRVET
jgi:hypothetical protein